MRIWRKRLSWVNGKICFWRNESLVLINPYKLADHCSLISWKMTLQATISIGHMKLGPSSLLVWICSIYPSANLVAANSTSDPLWRHQTLLSSSQEGKLLHNFQLARSQQPPVKHQEHLLGHKDQAALVPPPYRQDPLLRQLALLLPDDDHNGLQPPSLQQDPLLRQLKVNHGGKAPKGLLAPKLDQTGLLASHQEHGGPIGGGRFLSPPNQHLKSDRIMNMAHTLVGPDFKSSVSALSAEKRRKLMKMEAKVKALLFELEPRQKPSLVQSEQRNQQEQKTAPLILDNSIITGQNFAEFQSQKQTKDGGKTSDFQEESKRSKFQSLLAEMTKAMVALETVSKSRK